MPQSLGLPLLVMCDPHETVATLSERIINCLQKIAKNAIQAINSAESGMLSLEGVYFCR